MTLLRVIVFSVLVLLVYTVFANIVPQVQSNPPEEEASPLAGELDMAGMIGWGERIFSGKGTCTLCHNDLGRAPDILALDLNATFAERLSDPRYSGDAKGGTDAAAIAAYIHESMIKPSAFVVAGFGKKGSNDTVSPMPVVIAPPISLSDAEVNAVIAFLQDRAGFEPTVELPVAGDAPAAGAATEEDGPATTPEDAIGKFGCAACHDLQGSGADAGPNLNDVGKRLGRAGISEAILNPNGQIVQGFEADIMPQDFGDQMRVNELKLVIDYLMGLSGGATQ